MRTLKVCLCTWTLNAVHQDGFTNPSDALTKRKIKPGSDSDPHQISPYFQYPSDQTKAARVNKYRLCDFQDLFIQSYLEQGEIPRQGNSRRPHMRSQAFDITFCRSLLPHANLSLLHPNNFQNHSFLCVLQEENLCTCTGVSGVPSTCPHSSRHLKGRRPEPINSLVQLVPEWKREDQKARNIHLWGKAKELNMQNLAKWRQKGEINTNEYLKGVTKHQKEGLFKKDGSSGCN